MMMYFLVFVIELICAVHTSLCDGVKQYSGYLGDDELFFWFFESRAAPSRDPLILWLSGGPGGSSLASMLMGNGPCTLSLESNPNSWNRFANILYLDQPTGTGFSRGFSKVNTTEEAGRHVVLFLGRFLNQYPEYQDLDVHILSESYGGHFAPEIARQIHFQNPQNVNPIRLKSIAIASPFIDPKSQFPMFVDAACQHPSLPDSTCKKMKRSTLKCRRQTRKCHDASSCYHAYSSCTKKLVMPYTSLGLDMYSNDPKIKADEISLEIYDMSETIFNHPYIQTYLNVSGQFQAFNKTIYKSFAVSGDAMTSFGQTLVPLMNAGYRVLLYSGTKDLFCNSRGIVNLATSLVPQLQYVQWNHTRQNKKKVISTKTYGNIQVSKIHNASHWISMEHPSKIYDLMYHWVKGEGME